jgi:hypothetical protein
LTFNHYGGSFNSTFTASEEASIAFYGADVNFQEGSDKATWFNGPTLFQSYYTQSTSYYSTSKINQVVFNTSGLAVSWAQFYGVNIIFNYDGWVMDSNFTNNAIVNTTSKANVYLSGTTRFIGTASLSAIDGTLWIYNEYGSELYPDSDFQLLGPVVFVNNGTITSDNSGDIYWHPESWFVNLGQIDISDYTISMYGSSFPDGTTKNIGTFVNKGTISFLNSGGSISYYSTTYKGEFKQCNDGVLKFTFGTKASSSSSTFNGLSLDGWIGVVFEEDYTLSSYYNLFSWDESLYQNEDEKGIFVGNVDEFTKGPGKVIPTAQILCANENGNIYLYSLKDGSCSKQAGTSYTNSINDGPTGGVCNPTDVPKEIGELVASCPVGADCGLATGHPLGTGSTASSIPVSLALLVSLVGFLFYY